jgi:DNA-binding transcriptional regulator YhcF (GntR family)
VDKNEVKYLNFSIDARSAVPVFKQIKQAIKRFIASGYLVQGDKLMSIRDMASLHSIHPNTIVKVYSQLEIEGYVSSRPGSGYFVKTESGQIENEKEILLKDAAREFLSKTRQLGYSLEEILPILTVTERTLSSENEKGNEE